MDSFAAAIGNIVYDKSAAANDHDKQVFWGMDLFSYLFASFVATAYFCLFQPFMGAWMGERWLLPLGFVLVFCLNEYVGWNHRMLGSYRAVLGHFEQDQWFMVSSAVVNLILSFILFPMFDITGADVYKRQPEMGAAAQRRINEHFLWQNSAELALTLLPAKGNRHG